ncbi:MAG: hypothetical protein ACRDTB_34380, partial [Actinophytocola sp.]
PVTPPPWSGPPKEATRLDVHPFSEPSPNGPGTSLHREPVPSGPTPRPPVRQARPARRPPPAGRAWSIALTVLAIVAAMLVGILVATLLSSARDNGEGSRGDQTSQPQPAENDARPGSAEYVQAVRDYYALLPEDTDTAYDLLSGRAKVKSGGKRTYEQFWNTIESVEVASATADGDRVDAVLLYEKKDGGESEEPTSFELVEKDGQLLITDFDS